MGFIAIAKDDIRYWKISSRYEYVLSPQKLINWIEIVDWSYVCTNNWNEGLNLKIAANDK